MAYDVPIRMPKMSMTMTEGELVSWSVAPGEPVSVGDTVCEVMTDKVDMEVEAPVDGTLLRIDVEQGVVAVGTAIAWICSDQPDPMGDLLEDDPQRNGATAEPAPTAAPAPKTSADEVEVPAPGGPDPVLDRPASPAPTAPARASTLEPVGAGTAPAAGPVAAVPRARFLAREHSLDLRALEGTGPGARVLVADVERALTAIPAQPAPAARTGPPVASATTPVVPQPVPATSGEPAARNGTPRAAASTRRAAAVRAAVARTMTASAAVPQFTVWRDLDLEPLEASRWGISYTTLLLRAYAAALREVPALRTRWDGAAAQPVDQLAVGLAVDTPDGLLVPVFNDPDLVPVEVLDADVRSTAATARTGRIDAVHLLPATGMLSNLGGLGVDRFQALVIPPQASVLSAGASSRRPVAVPGGLGVGLRVTVGLTVDHRVADGADGARALAALALSCAQPLRLLGPAGVRP